MTSTTNTHQSNASDEAYRLSGVDLKRADAAVDVAKAASAQTQRATAANGISLLSHIGGFSGAFTLPAGIQEPVLLTACDGVGTKLKLAFESGFHDKVGIDLVAMSVNDILVNGGQPLVFLDYLATSEIHPDQMQAVLTGISEGCQQSDCVLIGGETAEMPGFYQQKEYDLAGFCVGVAEKAQLYPRIDKVQEGDVIIGLASSGLHSNGFSLVRRILDENNIDIQSIDTTLSDQPIYQSLLSPTRIYVQPVLKALQAHPNAVKAMAHITGGGFYDNLPRVLPDHLGVHLDSSTWTMPPVFEYIKTLGKLSNETLWHTFNAGIGYVLIVSASQADTMISTLKASGCDYPVQIIGEVVGYDGQNEATPTPHPRIHIQ